MVILAKAYLIRMPLWLSLAMLAVGAVIVLIVLAVANHKK
jgi:uncharacterized membrane protein